MPEILETSFLTIQPSGQTYELKDASARTNLNTLTDDIANFDLELEAIKKSVSDGKILLADAITHKGVITEADSELTFMAEQIKKIRSGGGYSGQYYSNYNIKDYGIPIYNGYPYVYFKDDYNDGTKNNAGVIADYTWVDSNDWHLLSQYHRHGDGSHWLEACFLMGLYNEDTQTGLGLSVDDNTENFYLRCYTSNSPDTSTEFRIVVDRSALRVLNDIFFDLHYVYNSSTGNGTITLKYADASQEILNWVTLYSNAITLAPNSFGKPIYLSGTNNLCYWSKGYEVTQLNIGECALVLDGYIDWGNSTLFPFREGETPY